MDEPIPESQSSKDRAWTTEEIRKQSSNWTLAGDVGLFHLLNEFAHDIISRTHEVENAVDSLVHQTKMTTAKINNVINDFHMLSSLQFVENRVYEEDIQEPVTEIKAVVEKTKEQREAEMLPKIAQAIELGLAVLDTAFDRINVNEISDSEDEEDISSEGRTILEPKDPYENRPLPYIIGSEEFMKCDYAGLKDLIEDDVLSFSEESSVSETDETSSDEGEPLPLDDDGFSEKQVDQISQNISDKISSSDESELFGSEKEMNGFDSQSPLEFKSKEKNIQRTSADTESERTSRQNSVSSLQSKLKLPQVLPVPKLQERNEDLFSKDDNSDEESLFHKKSGLFASDVIFKDKKDDDLFGGDLFEKSHSEDIKEVKSVEVPKAVPKKLPISLQPEAKRPTLFDNDEDSEDDIFNTLMKSKKLATSKTSNADSPDSPEMANTSSTPSSAPSTNPSGNAFDFVTGGGKSDSLFADDSDGDDLFSSKKTPGRSFHFDSSENDDLFDTATSKVLKDSKPKDKEYTSKEITKISLFEDSDNSDEEKKVVPNSVSVPPKKKIGLFSDDDMEEDMFSNVAKETKPSKPVEKSKPSNFFSDDMEKVSKETKHSKPVEESKPSNLFNDDIKEVSKVTKPSKPVEESKPSNLFNDDIKEMLSKDSKPVRPAEKPKSTSLFDDDEEESTEILPSISKVPQSKLPSLFDDSDSFDLFAPQQPMRHKESIEPVKPIKVSKPNIETSKLKNDVDGTVALKTSPIKDANNDQVSFDVPVDNTNVLNVINKGRVKMAVKRRKPTRQGRLAALENSERETHLEDDSVAPSTNSNLDVDVSNVLFSNSITNKTLISELPKQDYKSQEKKKMNLMSQLISEVATSKIALKRSVEKEEKDEDDEVNLFSEASTDNSKNSFSFKTPEENGISSMFPVEKKDDLNVSKSDSFEDDFFTEPAFQNFRSSISHKDPPVLDLEDDDDDDDLFSAIKGDLPKVKIDSSDPNELFVDDTDIFADIQKEKYEMFPNQIYDEDDDIFSNVNNDVNTSSKTNNSSSIKKVETKQVDAFDDPLTGLLGE